MTNFIELGLSKPLSALVAQLGFTQPTEIQEKTIPHILSGQDVLASAQTGSGKTAAYALPIIECLEVPDKSPRALILAPTRELAQQVEQQFQMFGEKTKLRAVTIYGGSGYEQQRRELKRGVDIVVATPGRLLDLVESGDCKLSAVEILVLDEADRLLDMGFMPQVRKIIRKLSPERQTLMFSATIDDRVKYIASEFQMTPVTIQVNTARIEPTEIEQRMYHVNEFNKDALLAQLIQESKMDSVIVFTRTRRKANWVKSRLREVNVMAEEIHGEISQAQREKTLSMYRNGAFSVLVATDVAARGLDIPSISHVINYDLPDSPEDYVHRIGRTGRAGRSGVALSFVSDEQRHLIRDIEKITGRVLDPNTQARKTQALRRPPVPRRRRFI
ncbi:MAG TPA: DEAD/DEAH box helicase [Oculatellaceae cyanobacterium]